MSNIAIIILTMSIIASGVITTEITEKERLVKDIIELSYYVSDIEYGIFDCSNTVSITQNELSKKGWDARILLLRHIDRRHHAMVKVYGENENYYIECTRKSLVSTTPLGYYKIDEYQDVVDAVENSGYGVNEWEYSIYIEQLGAKRWKPKE